MHKNPLWLAFLGFFSIAVLIYVGIAAYSLIIYSRLSAVAPIQNIQAEIIKKSDDLFLVDMHYSFEVEGTTYQAVEIHSGRPLLNAWAAQELARELEEKANLIWYSPEAPALSTLHLRFPWRATIAALSLLALEFYFIGLGWRVGKQYGSEPSKLLN